VAGKASEKIGTSEVVLQAAVSHHTTPESTSEADNSVKVCQIPVTLTPISPSSSQPPVPEQDEDNTVLENLVHHYSSDLPKDYPNSEKAYETTSGADASVKVVSERPQQHTPEPEKTPSPQQQPTNTHIDPQYNLQTEQTLPQPTPMVIDNNSQASTSTVQANLDQPSSSTQTGQNLTIPEPNLVQDLSLSASDQPSDLQILEQPPLDILESEYIVTKLLKISSEMQDLIQLRRLLDLPIAYEEQWSSLKKKASDLLDAVSNKCIRTKAAAVRRFFKISQSVKRARGLKLLLTNEPFYSEADYVTREARIFKMLKQKLARQ